MLARLRKRRRPRGDDLRGASLTHEQATALQAAHAGRNLFLTGGAGSGKSHTARLVVAEQERAGRSMLVTASSGIAASNINGRTIHSVLGTRVAQSPADLVAFVRTPQGRASIQAAAASLRRADTLLLEEVSMCSGVFLQMMDQLLRQVRRSSAPMGGLQLVLVGDFCQLPPVWREGDAPPAYRYAFQAPVWSALNLTCVNLSTPFRQQRDPDFHEMLDAFRKGRLLARHAELLDRRKRSVREVVDAVPTPTLLFPTRRQVSDHTRWMLEREPFEEREPFTFRAEVRARGLRRGDTAAWEQRHGGDFIADAELTLKQGCPVIFTASLDARRGLVNGRRGVVADINKHQITVEVLDERGRKAGTKTLHTTNDRWEWERRDGAGRVVASIKQVPLKCALAISVHKAQGLTISPVHVALTSSFAPGQVYVALSRARTLQDLTVDTKLEREHIHADPECVRFQESLE